MFAEPFFKRPPTLIQLEPDGPFDHDLVALVDDIQAHSIEHPYTLAMKTMALVATLFERPANLHGKTAYNVAIRRANLHIAHHLGEVIDFPALAQKCDMGYSLFRKCFRKDPVQCRVEKCSFRRKQKQRRQDDSRRRLEFSAQPETDAQNHKFRYPADLNDETLRKTVGQKSRRHLKQYVGKRETDERKSRPASARKRQRSAAGERSHAEERGIRQNFQKHQPGKR